MENGKYSLGLASVSFRRHSPKEILDAARAASLECIEWGSDVHAPCRDTDRLREISELQKQYGIFCSSYGTYFRFGETPIGELEHYIKGAQLLGTDILRLWCGVKSGKEMTDAEKDSLFSACRKAESIAKESGVTLCMECHKNTFTESPDDAVYLMQEINSPHFRMYGRTPTKTVKTQKRSLRLSSTYTFSIGEAKKSFRCHVPSTSGGAI